MSSDTPPPCRIFDFSAGERPSAAYWEQFDKDFGATFMGSRARQILRRLHKTGTSPGGNVTTIEYDPAQDRVTVHADHSEPWEAIQLTWDELLDLVRARKRR
ncbi:MAG: hypothetical protein MUF73_17655 [Rhodobacteraceae bacterium]|nr:hypothetical protein [Paracoccaceae bacterium]